jgi:deoxyribose-phosphate aldolase
MNKKVVSTQKLLDLELGLPLFSPTDILKMVDLTCLTQTASESDIIALCESGINAEVAGICINPIHVGVARQTIDRLSVDHKPKVVTVVGFPLSQNVLPVKLLETKIALADGADEIDLVLNVGAFLEGNHEVCRSKIEAVSELVKNSQKMLKVILESGVIGGHDSVKEASLLALASGADFIKTSTGMMSEGASVEAVRAMSEAIKESGLKKVGLKVSGGIRTEADAQLMLNEIRFQMGFDFVNPECCRIGASSLVKQLTGESTSPSSQY